MDTIVPGSLFDKSKELIIIPDVVIVLWAIVCVCVSQYEISISGTCCKVTQGAREKCAKSS